MLNVQNEKTNKKTVAFPFTKSTSIQKLESMSPNVEKLSKKSTKNKTDNNKNQAIMGSKKILGSKGEIGASKSQIKDDEDEQRHQQNLSSLLTSLTKVIRTTNAIPSDDEYDFQISLLSHEDYTTHVVESKKMVYDIMHSITKAVEEQSESTSSEGVDLGLENIEENDNYDNEYLLELSNGIMDDLLSSVEFYLNPNKNNNGISSNDNIKSRVLANKSNKLQELISNIVPMTKPQITYNIKVDNDRTTTFKPKVDNESRLIKINGHGISGIKNDDDGYELPNIHYEHPYKNDIENISYPDFIFNPPDIKTTTYEEDLSYEYINTIDQLSKLSSLLEQEKEIAIDLEHHSYHTFQGITCLLQISSRSKSKNYLVDTLVLHNEMYKYLKPTFMNPNIVKIIHGCYNDILWLQRDFSLYLVNVFDTCVASKILACTSSNRLSSLISKYCPSNVNIDKSFQLSDWRQRPLTDEMKRYAVMDTRYLYRIYDAQRHELIQKGVDKNSDDDTSYWIHQVLKGSNVYALKVYNKEPIYKSNGYERYIPHKKRHLKITDKQHNTLKSLWNWRDKEARKRDESLHYICPTNILISLGLDGCSYVWTDVMKECKSIIMSFINNDFSFDNTIIANTEKQKLSSQGLPLSSTVQEMEEVTQEEEEWELNHNMIHIHPSNKDYTPTSSLFYHQSITSSTTTTTKLTPSSLQKHIINQLHDTMKSYIYPTWIKKKQEQDESSSSGMKRKLFSEDEQQQNKDKNITSIQEQYDIPIKNKNKKSNVKKQKINQSNTTSTSDQQQKSKVAIGLLPSETTTNDNPFFTGAAITADKSIIKEVGKEQKKITSEQQKRKKNNKPKYTRSNPNDTGNKTFVYVKK